MNITKDSIWSLLIKITVPASTGSLFMTFYNLVDTFFAGKISPEALAAVAKSWPITFIALAISIGVQAGTQSLISNSVGAKENKLASLYVAQSITLAIIISIFVTLFGLNFSEFLLKIMGSSQESIILTREYLDIIFYGSIIILVQLSLNGTLAAQGDTKSYRNILIISFFLNIFLNPLFIFGYGIIPAFGIAGLAISTLIAQGVGVLYLIYKVYCCKLKKFLYLQCFIPKINLLINLFKQSVPIMFTMLMIMFGVFNIFYFVGQFGELSTAGYGTAVRIEQVLLLPVIGLNTAVLTIAGQNYGAKFFNRIKEVYGKALFFGSGFMIIAGVIIYLSSSLVISFFTTDQEVIRSGALYLKVAALIGPIYPVFFITSALFQALKLAIYSLYMTIIRLTLIPFLSLWYVINIRGGEYQDIFYTIMVTNWLMGLAVLSFIPFLLRKKLRMSFKKVFAF
ncbi:MATE family efflux transporter [Pelagibacteraceae bacterium]|jgi:putative MATE family efflux protein|nr:MATE family efflux transporter [Pelagibacteraceae bacterium]